MSNKKEIINLFIDFMEEISSIFMIKLEDSFTLSMSILSLEELPKISNIKEEENQIILNYYTKFKDLSYSKFEIRRALSEAYLYSLKHLDKYIVDVTLELPLLYLSLIKSIIISKSAYTKPIILNANGNNGNLALSLSAKNNPKEELYVTVENDKFLKVASLFKSLGGGDYDISTSIPNLSFRADLIISDPFLRNTEDILVFFEDYTEYLNDQAFFVVTLPTDFVRSRVFSDLILDKGLVFVGLIEYPIDLLDGLIKSSIVILEKTDKTNKEFFHASMPSVKEIDKNVQVMDSVRDYLNEYLGDE